MLMTLTPKDQIQEINQRKAKDMDDYLDIPAFLRRQAD